MESEKKLNKIFDNSLYIGDIAYNNFKKTKSNKDGQLSIQAYKCALRAEMLKIIKKN